MSSEMSSKFMCMPMLGGVRGGGGKQTLLNECTQIRAKPGEASTGKTEPGFCASSPTAPGPAVTSCLIGSLITTVRSPEGITHSRVPTVSFLASGDYRYLWVLLSET